MGQFVIKQKYIYFVLDIDGIKISQQMIISFIVHELIMLIRIIYLQLNILKVLSAKLGIHYSV